MYKKNVEKVEELIREQNEWRSETINLIASENSLSKRAREGLGSDFAHRYAEGHPGKRYYQGTEKIDAIETMVKQQLKALFDCRNVDVRPTSGTVANDAVFSRFIKPGDIVMVNSTSGGGHISHHRHGSVGKYTGNIINFPYTEDHYHIDVKETIRVLERVPVKVMIMGKSLYLFPDPVKELAQVCSDRKIILLYDAAHVLGLIAGKQFHDPLKEGAMIVLGSTHKTFFGTQRGLVYSNMKEPEWLAVERGTFPGSTSNHHLDTLAVLAIAVFEFMEYGAEYAKQVVKNAKALGKALDKKGFKVEAKKFGFTESHQIAVDVKELGGGNDVAKILENNGIICNMNLLPFDPLGKVTNPSGLRLGAQEMTRFGMKEKEMEMIAEFFKRCLVKNEYVGDEVREFRRKYQVVHYSFDHDFLKIAGAGKAKAGR